VKDFVFVWLVDESTAIVMLWVADCQLWRVLRVITDDGEPLDNGNTFDMPILSTQRFSDAWQVAASQGGGHDEPDVYEVETACPQNQPFCFLN
jgi:hypothetical protein